MRTPLTAAVACARPAGRRADTCPPARSSSSSIAQLCGDEAHLVTPDRKERGDTQHLLDREI
ncbi:hypothetical protein B7435_07185 [Mycolicibacterium peregrinum]|nr:hypothetical protein B7435_07185 [Mycolicibacterium peregrinum]